jgi:hypothetical protein
MTHVKFRVVALVLAMALLLTGCALDFGGYFDRLANVFRPVSFENMTYTRPEPQLLEDALAECLESIDENNFNKLLSHINSLNSIANSFQTSFYLSYIHYSIDMTDRYWETEYNFCSQLTAQVQASVDELMYALAESEMRERLEDEAYFGPGYFDDFDGESMWTEEFTALKHRETELVNEYYRLSSMMTTMDPTSETFYSTLGAQMGAVYTDLVKLRKELATEAGYDSYAEFAYEFTYDRDFTPKQAMELVGEIRKELAEPYSKLTQSNWWTDLGPSREDETFNYVKTMANAMGGRVQEAFSTMENSGLYHISYGPNKVGASFTVYLPDYWSPFVFLNPTLTAYDRLTFAHEFGHFCNAYASGGGSISIDVSEVFSQGMEYLSLFYADGGNELEKIKLADSLGVYLEQSMLADFEDRVYRMSDKALTVENIRALYSQVAWEYGLGDMVDGRSYVNVTHLFTSPMYVISYVVSHDTAMQIYQMERKESGSGLRCYTDHLATQQVGFTAFLEEAGLESPFRTGHIKEVRELFEEILEL